MTEHNPLPTREAVERWYQKVTKAGKCPEFEGWPDNLFRKSAAEITEYLADRFRQTQDIYEYHLCILYLKYSIPDEELFTPWKESQNYARLQDTHTNPLPEDMTAQARHGEAWEGQTEASWWWSE